MIKTKTKKQKPTAAHSTWPQRVKLIRKRYGIRQQDLAEVLRIHPMSITYWETGTRKPSTPARRLLELIEEDQNYATKLFKRFQK